MSKYSDSIMRGMSVLRENPQIIYTVFLLIIIPVAFVASGQRFLKASVSNQERTEKERIGLMQDIFSEFASHHLNNQQFIQERIESIQNQNPSITAFRVSVARDNNILVIASLSENDIGKTDNESKAAYGKLGLPTDNSQIIATFVNGERHWKAFRLMRDEPGNVLGIIMTDVSMADIDKAALANIKSAYTYLALIIIAIFILLILHARMIDYVRLYKNLREADKMKDDFISIASHELRAPLTAIRWQAETLAEGSSDSNSVMSIQKSAGQLEKLVEDMLDVSRIEQRRMKFDLKKINAQEVIKSVIDLLKPTAAEKGLPIKFEGKQSRSIVADPARLSQVLTNIINNAIKYTPKGKIEVESFEEHNRLNIRVRDTGMGISADDQKKLFQKFSRIKSDQTRGISGTGLGLWITKQMVVAMKGEISVESMKDVGSSFTVSFPIAADDQEKTKKE